MKLHILHGWLSYKDTIKWEDGKREESVKFLQMIIQLRSLENLLLKKKLTKWIFLWPRICFILKMIHKKSIFNMRELTLSNLSSAFINYRFLCQRKGFIFHQKLGLPL